MRKRFIWRLKRNNWAFSFPFHQYFVTLRRQRRDDAFARPSSTSFPTSGRITVAIEGSH